MENVHFFTSYTDINVHFGTSTNSSSKPYEYHGALCPTGMILNIYSAVACNFSASSLDLAHNRFTLNSAISSSYFRVEIGSPVRKTFSIYSRGSNRSVTIFADSIDSTYGTGGKLKGYVGNNDITLRQSTTSYYLVGNNIELNDIANIIDIDINLGNGEDHEYQNTTSFKQRYPIVKIGENNDAYYQPTDGQSLSTDRTYTFLTMIGHSYTSDTDQGDFIDGYCTNIKLESSNSAKNNAPKSETVKLEAVNTDPSTQEINGYETYIGPDNKILDRQRIHPYGSQSAQISLISSLPGSTSPSKPYYIQKNQSNETILPKSTVYSRSSPLILYVNSNSDYQIEDNIVGLDTFHLLLNNNNTIRIPLKGTVKGYYRQATNPQVAVTKGGNRIETNGKVVLSEMSTFTYFMGAKSNTTNTITATAEISNTYITKTYSINRNTNQITSQTTSGSTQNFSKTAETNIDLFMYDSDGMFDMGVRLGTCYYDMAYVHQGYTFKIEYTLKNVPIIPNLPNKYNQLPVEPPTQGCSRSDHDTPCLGSNAKTSSGNGDFIHYMEQHGGAFGSNRVLGGIRHKFTDNNGMCGSFLKSFISDSSKTMQVFIGDTQHNVSVDQLDTYDNDQAGATLQTLCESSGTLLVGVAYPEN